MAARTIGGGGGECTSPTVDAEESERNSGIEHEGQQQTLDQALPVVQVSATALSWLRAAASAPLHRMKRTSDSSTGSSLSSRN